MTLQKFRAQIDAIDDQIIELLKQRTEIVKQVGEFKKETSQAQSFIRAGREASMLRNLTQKASGVFPPQAIATIWRMVISSSLSIEQEMSIYAYSGTDNNCLWLAREYFGTFLPMFGMSDAQKLISTISNNPSAVGVLPLIDNSNSPWWVRPEGESNNIYVFARIPFIEDKSEFIKPALAIANTIPEPTDEDISLLGVTTNVGEETLKEIFKQNHLNINIISTSGKDNFLLEIDQFIEAGDEIINKIRQELGGGSILRLMGAYAVPMKI